MTSPQANQDQSSKSFDSSNAAALLQAARLPELFEKELHASNKDNATKVVKENLPPGISPENVFILQRDNITAIIIVDPKTNIATVSIDPTYSGGNILTNPDYRDNINRSPQSTSLGGTAHGGLLQKLTSAQEDPPAPSLINRIEGILHDLASRQETPLTVNFTGFSKGGAQAMLAAGEMMADGIFENSNIKLGQLTAFSPVAFASDAYIQNFNAKVQSLGGHATTVELHGDKNPTILTPQASSMFTRYDYDHIGQHVYIMPQTSQGPAQIIENPSAEDLKKLRASTPGLDGQHDSGILLHQIQNTIPKQEPSPAIQPSTPSQKLPSL